MQENEFKEDLKIDPENLDAEACVQPELYFKWASLAKDAREEMDMAKFNLEITESELSKTVREKPAAFGVRKITEGSIAIAVKTHPDYQSAYKYYIKTKSEFDIMNKAQEAMEQRKRSIELLVQLHSREYFSGPSVPHTPADLWKKVKEKKGEEVQKEMVSRTKKRKKKVLLKRKSSE